MTAWFRATIAVMVFRIGGAAALVLAAGCGGAMDEKVAALEARVARLEASLAPAAPATTKSDDAQPDLEPAAPAAHTAPVAFELGDAEFYDGDEITIREIAGTQATMDVGGSYLVKGHYRLQSHDSATLLLSVTVTEGSGHGTTRRTARLKVSRGEGDFELLKRLGPHGYPHLTYYGPDGHPFGGVYFGSGPWLLPHKSWRYNAGPVENDRISH